MHHSADNLKVADFDVCTAEVVEYSCNLAPDLMGEYVENVSTGMDTYSIKQPLGVSHSLLPAHTPLSDLLASSSAAFCNYCTCELCACLPCVGYDLIQ